MLLLLVGCDDDALAPASDLATAMSRDLASGDLARPLADLAMAPDLALSPTYPAGPYGNTVGATIPPLTWEGYSDPLADAIASSKPYGSYSMNDLRMSGSAYGVVHVALYT
jgi:hypothetical protein